MPSNSRYYEALTNNEEYAEQLAKLPEPDEPWSPRQAEFGLTEHLLTNLDDKLQYIAHILLKSNGGNPGQFKPSPRPKSKIDEVKERLEYEWAKDFIQRLGFDADDI